MSITTLANYPDAVVGLLGFGALFLAFFTLFRNYLAAFSLRALEIPSPKAPYIPPELDQVQRVISFSILSAVFLSITLIFIYIISNCLWLFTMGFICLFISMVVITAIVIIVASWIGVHFLNDMKNTKRIETELERLFEEDLKELQKEETE